MAVGGSFQSRLKAKIEELNTERLESLLRGSPEDYAKYREQVGFFDALRAVMRLCDEVESDINKGD